MKRMGNVTMKSDSAIFCLLMGWNPSQEWFYPLVTTVCCPIMSEIFQHRPSSWNYVREVLTWLSASGFNTNNDEVLWKAGTRPRQFICSCSDHKVYLFWGFFMGLCSWRLIRNKLNPYLTNETVCCGVRGGAAVRAFKSSFSSCSSAMWLQIKMNV